MVRPGAFLIAGLHIRVHRSIGAAHEDLATPGLAGYGFQTAGWLRAWEASFGRRRGTMPLIVTAADDAVRMVLPLCLERRGGLTILCFAGGYVTDYNAPRLDAAFAAGLDDDALARLWARILRHLPRHDLVRFDRMPATIDAADGDLPIANPWVRLAGARVAGRAPRVALPAAYDMLARRLRPKLVADNGRMLRRLGEAGPVSLRVHEDAAARRAMLARLQPMKARRWQETGGRDAYRDPAFAAFYDRLAAEGGSAAAVHASELLCGETVVAAHIGIVYRQRFYLLLFGWAGDAWKRYGPGRLMVEALIRQSIDDGLAVFDFTVGDEPYKREWADGAMDVYALERAASWRGVLALALAAMRGRIAGRLRGIGPLRAFVRRATGKRPHP